MRQDERCFSYVNTIANHSCDAAKHLHQLIHTSLNQGEFETKSKVKAFEYSIESIYYKAKNDLIRSYFLSFYREDLLQLMIEWNALLKTICRIINKTNFSNATLCQAHLKLSELLLQSTEKLKVFVEHSNTNFSSDKIMRLKEYVRSLKVHSERIYMEEMVSIFSLNELNAQVIGRKDLLIELKTAIAKSCSTAKKIKLFGIINA